MKPAASMPGDYLSAMASAAPVASAPAASRRRSRRSRPPAALSDLYSGAVVSGSYTKPAKATVKPAVSMPGDYLSVMASAAPVASAPAAAAARGSRWPRRPGQRAYPGAVAGSYKKRAPRRPRSRLRCRVTTSRRRSAARSLGARGGPRRRSSAAGTGPVVALNDLYSGAVAAATPNRPRRPRIAVAMPGDYLTAKAPCGPGRRRGGRGARDASRRRRRGGGRPRPRPRRPSLTTGTRVPSCGELLEAEEGARKTGGVDAGRLSRVDGLAPPPNGPRRRCRVTTSRRSASAAPTRFRTA